MRSHDPGTRRLSLALAVGIGLSSLVLTAARPAAHVGHEPKPVTDSPTVANPKVTGPITYGTRGGAYNRSRFPLEHGYVEEEFFYEGMATAADGTREPYKTRILVRRPSDPKDFNGAVILDWTNVTVPDDTDVGWLPMHDTIMERGFAYVAVAAQRLAIEASPIALKQFDPVRYGSLSHPGDDYSFDIFSQASEAILDPLVLDDLRPGSRAATRSARRSPAGVSRPTSTTSPRTPTCSRASCPRSAAPTACAATSTRSYG